MKRQKKEAATAISPVVRHLLPTRLDFEVDYVQQPGLLRKIFVVRNLPRSITRGNNGILRKLMQLPNTTVTTRIASMDAATAKKLIDRQYNNSLGTAVTRAGMVTQVIEAQGEASDLASFYEEMQRHAGEGAAIKLVNIYIEIYGVDRQQLRENEDRLKGLCGATGITIESFDHYQKEGYLGVCPFGRETRSQRLANNIPSNTFGRLFPFSASSLIDPEGMLLGRTADDGLMSVDIWSRNLMRTNSSISVVGDQGQGKSYLVKKVIAQQRMRGTTIFCIDHEREYVDEFRQLGGISVNCANGRFAINPLQVRCFQDQEDEPEEDEGREPGAFGKERSSPLLQHLGWLGDFFPVLIPSLSERQLSALKILVQDTYGKFGITEDTDFHTRKTETYPLLEDVYGLAEDILNHREKYKGLYQMIDNQLLADLLLLLHEACKGSLAPQFNRHTNLQDGTLVNLDISDLLTGSQTNLQAVLFNYMTYIWGMIVGRKKPFLLVVDELHLQLDPENPTTARYLSSFVRRARKYNASLVTATQKLRDCLSGSLANLTAPILDTPTYKFLFFPGDVEVSMLEKLQLTPGEIRCISSSHQRNCLVKIGKSTYQMTVGALPFEERLFGKGGGR